MNKVIDLYEEFGLSRRDIALLPMDFKTRVGHFFSSKRKLAAGKLYCYDTDDLKIKKPAMLIFPGGAYLFNSHTEWENIAKAFSARGFRTFVLNYSTKYFKFPTQLNEAAMAVAYIRRNSAALGVTDRVAVCGFSAGGHLAASLSLLYADESVHSNLKVLGVPLRPDACVLAYPVISSDDALRNEQSFHYLCGEDVALRSALSLEKRVHKDAPPTFLWHTEEDATVPCGNSVVYAERLKEVGVPVKLRLYKKGKHGLNLAQGYEAEKWVDEATEFLILN